MKAGEFQLTWLAIDVRNMDKLIVCLRCVVIRYCSVDEHICWTSTFVVWWTSSVFDRVIEKPGKSMTAKMRAES